MPDASPIRRCVRARKLGLRTYSGRLILIEHGPCFARLGSRRRLSIRKRSENFRKRSRNRKRRTVETWPSLDHAIFGVKCCDSRLVTIARSAKSFSASSRLKSNRKQRTPPIKRHPILSTLPRQHGKD